MTIKTNFSSLSHGELLNKLTLTDPAALLLALVEMTGDMDLLVDYKPYITGPTNVDVKIPQEKLKRLHQLMAEHLMNSGISEDSVGSEDVIRVLADTVSGRMMSESEKDLVLKEMGVLASAHIDWNSDRPELADSFSVTIIGAGMSGIATAIHLKRMGIPFKIYDSNPEAGGTWLVNTYPGCGVDIASHYFSFSFARKTDWKRYYAKQPEILAYLQECVRTFGLEEHITYGARVNSATYDEAESEWVLDLSAENRRQTVRSKILVSGLGQLSVPSVPDLPGRDKFTGKAFHSADWDHTADYAGKKVILVGNGASGNQIGPAIAPEVAQLTVLQRSPQWVVGVPGYLEEVPEDVQWALQNIPAYERWFRVRTMVSMNDIMRPSALVDHEWKAEDGTISQANQELRDRLVKYMTEELGSRQDLLSDLIPSFPPLMKRMLRDNGWIRMFRRENVELVNSRAVEFSENGIVDGEGRVHEADVVVFATGFKAARMLSSVDFTGKSGVTIRDSWGEEDPRAYLGMTVPDFPNLFVLYGPNTNVGVGGSIFFQAEAQSGYVATMIRDMIENNLNSIEVRSDVFENYNARMDKELDRMIWSLPTGSTWYRNSKGRVTANMPWTSPDYWQMTREASLDDYVIAPLSAVLDEVRTTGNVKQDAAANV
ncbi:flavin-containing monooxygenase [Glutamicibacter sp. NPDC127525]|uniref:flavin-containing monooxygenase n=1 Tax=unclassified Glutamicibacter TaxID=2627139 RepID=UPI00363A10F2